MEGEQYSNALEIAEKLSYLEEDYIFSNLRECIETGNIHFTSDFTQPQLVLKFRKILPSKAWYFDIIDMLYNHLDDINLNKLVA